MPLVGLAVIWLKAGTTTLIQQRTPISLIGPGRRRAQHGRHHPPSRLHRHRPALIAGVPYRILLAVMTTMLIIATHYLRMPRLPPKPRSSRRAQMNDATRQ